ncbi:alpha/beta hydrolase domain-containing protein [Amycolatopsis pigmentata]|uniref:Alpha/beta hydrolase domain-containing protein n=1 Tax=Amycolatopsis pigmentata TaxID=450801 RepID=A0ABW5FK69_9PSEU
MTVLQAHRLETSAHSLPLGVARLPGTAFGVDLEAAGYREDEYLVSGNANAWTYDEHGQAVPDADVPYTTRILVRRPVDEARFDGVVQAEPLHPEYDTAISWRVLHPWIMRTGAAWVGITQEPRIAESLRAEFDPARYGRLSIPAPSLRYDIVADVVTALRTRAFGLWDGPEITRAYLSGWSMTGSFCRVFLGEGFHERRRLPGGEPIFDGYVIAISSGGAARAGYPGLSNGPDQPTMRDPRRIVGSHGVPVIELLSEVESETHGPVLRADSDDPADRYRLYQVAGTSHDSTGPHHVDTNQEQYRRRGLPVPSRRILETPSDARMDFVARAVFSLLDRWVADGQAPPHAERFTFEEEPCGEIGDAVPLARDEHGNVLGGIRTPWVETPVARYHPHSTPVPGECRPSPWMPMAEPEAMTWLAGHMTTFSADLLIARYPTAETYLTRYRENCLAMVGAGFLRWEEVEPLLVAAGHRALTLLPRNRPVPAR